MSITQYGSGAFAKTGINPKSNLRNATLFYPLIQGDINFVVTETQRYQIMSKEIFKKYSGGINCYVQQLNGCTKVDLIESVEKSQLEDTIIEWMSSFGEPERLVIKGDYENIVKKLKEDGLDASLVGTPGRGATITYRTEGPIGDCMG